jgi:flagellar basal body-associated protein FliL
MKDVDEYKNEQERIGDKKSLFLLILALLLASAVTIWIIMVFDKQVDPPRKVGDKQLSQVNLPAA